MSDKSKKHGKKRKKSYYIKCAHKKPKRENDLGEDMKGFLVTCNSNEKQAVREMYNILNEYADKIYGPEEFKKKANAQKEENESETDEEEEDMDKAMEKEIQAMKNMKSTQRRFQNVDTKAKNCIFIKTLLEDPCRIMCDILYDLAKSGVQKTRYAIRALPVQGTCKTHISDIEKLAKDLFKAYFETPFGTGVKFSIVFKSRNNHGIGRVSVIPALAQIINDMNPLHKVNHDDPDLVVLVEIVGTVCCLSVLKDFYKFRKYNLQEVTRPIVRKEDLKDQTSEKTDRENVINEAEEQNDVDVEEADVDNVEEAGQEENDGDKCSADVDNVIDKLDEVKDMDRHSADMDTVVKEIDEVKDVEKHLEDMDAVVNEAENEVNDKHSLDVDNIVDKVGEVIDVDNVVEESEREMNDADKPTTGVENVLDTV